MRQYRFHQIPNLTSHPGIRSHKRTFRIIRKPRPIPALPTRHHRSRPLQMAFKRPLHPSFKRQRERLTSSFRENPRRIPQPNRLLDQSRPRASVPRRKTNRL